MVARCSVLMVCCCFFQFFFLLGFGAAVAFGSIQWWLLFVIEAMNRWNKRQTATQWRTKSTKKLLIKPFFVQFFHHFILLEYVFFLVFFVFFFLVLCYDRLWLTLQSPAVVSVYNYSSYYVRVHITKREWMVSWLAGVFFFFFSSRAKANRSIPFRVRFFCSVHRHFFDRFFLLHHLVMFLLWYSVCKLQYVSIVAVFFSFFSCPMILSIICYWWFVVRSISLLLRLIFNWFIRFLFSYFYISSSSCWCCCCSVLKNGKDVQCNFGNVNRRLKNRNYQPFVKFAKVAWKAFGRSFFISFLFCVFAYEYWSIVNIGILLLACCILQILFEKYWETEEHRV